MKDPDTRARFDRGEIDSTGQERAEHRYYREHAEQPGNPYRSGAGQSHAGDFGASDIFAEFMRQQAQEGARFDGRGFDPRGGHGGFDVRGPDRHYTMEVSFLDAANGGSTRIVLPDGGALEVKIPAGTTDGKTLRMRLKGSPGSGQGPAGDALVTITVLPHSMFRLDGRDIFFDVTPKNVLVSG